MSRSRNVKARRADDTFKKSVLHEVGVEGNGGFGSQSVTGSARAEETEERPRPSPGGGGAGAPDPEDTQPGFPLEGKRWLGLRRDPIGPDRTRPPHAAPGPPALRTQAVRGTYQQALHVDGVSAPATHRLLCRVHERAGQFPRRPLLTHAAQPAAPGPRTPGALPPSPAPVGRRSRHAGSGSQARAGLAACPPVHLARPGRGHTRRCPAGRGGITQAGGERADPRLSGRGARHLSACAVRRPQCACARRRPLPRANPPPKPGARETKGGGIHGGDGEGEGRDGAGLQGKGAGRETTGCGENAVSPPNS